MQAFSNILSVTLWGILLVGMAGCKTVNEGKASGNPVDGAGAPMKIPVGSLHVVRPEEGFVLIRSTRFLQVEPGTDLMTYGNGGIETSRLRVSPARKGQFVTADILSGSPKVGDQVLMNHVAGAPGGMGSDSADDEIQVLE
ncbi:MAG: hypothetical protein P1U68_15655 [Verrucomicrobiales bacterium]|nr:hypothetical protein [Verrucomicrobiales bacterium]